MRKATVTKHGDSGHWFMIGEVIMDEGEIDENGAHQFVNEEGTRQWLFPYEFEYTEVL